MQDTDDAFYMRRAIELARGGEGRTNPNPLVGAVIVKDGNIIGEGFHRQYGQLHAEREALADCKNKNNDPSGATIYVTLEPCCHFGKQPPCCQALVENHISKVFVGSRDPNPLVHGKGNAYLREHGVIVEEDFLRQECDSLNPIFFHFISTKTPYVSLKYACTLDGKIATKSGKSKWISSEESRNFVHKLRNRYAAIMCGSGTLLADDPLLTCRLPEGRNPIRIICDTELKIPLESQIVKSAKEIPTIVACVNPPEAKKAQLEEKGLEVLILSADRKGKANLKELVKVLGSRQIDSILVEGGGELNYSCLESGIVQHIYAFIAPKIFGGKAKSPVSGDGVDSPDQAFNFKMDSVKQIGQDLLVEYNKS